jgi:hypothetical protein
VGVLGTFGKALPLRKLVNPLRSGSAGFLLSIICRSALAGDQRRRLLPMELERLEAPRELERVLLRLLELDEDGRLDE